MKKILLLLLVLTLLIVGAYRFDYGRTRDIVDGKLSNIINLDKVLLNNKSVALREARIVVQNALINNKGILTRGQCLSNILVPGWSLDIVHYPRTDEDNYIDNQCETFVSGEHKYLIEYSTTGDFVRIVIQE